MKDALAVRGFQRGGNLQRQLHGLVRREWSRGGVPSMYSSTR